MTIAASNLRSKPRCDCRGLRNYRHHKTHLVLDLIHLVDVFVKDVLPHKVGPFELFAGKRTKPLVFTELLGVGLR